MGFIAKAVVIALLLLSIWSLYIAIERLLAYNKAKKESLQFAKLVTQKLQQDKLQEIVDVASKFKWSHLARVTRAGLIEYLLPDAKGTLTADEKIEAVQRAIERETLIAASDFKKGTSHLATIATTAPFIGLFGTVVGIINAFAGMASTGSGGIGAVSAGIAEALVATSIGLFVAIPAAWMYNYFVGKLERFGVEMSNSASELVDYFIKKGALHGSPR
jgi:biopolymer transport protein ExbB/biopolymer transport protein TolQ